MIRTFPRGRVERNNFEVLTHFWIRDNTLFGRFARRAIKDEGGGKSFAEHTSTSGNELPPCIPLWIRRQSKAYLSSEFFSPRQIFQETFLSEYIVE